MTTVRVVLVGWLATCGAGALGAGASAQPGGTIQGRVSDATGELLEAATVTVEALDGSGRRLSTKTGEDGRFVQAGVIPGRYRVTAEKVGSGLQSFFVRVHGGQVADIVFRIEPGSGSDLWLETEDPVVVDRLRSLFADGAAADQAGQVDEAVAAYEQAVDLAPRCHQCHYNLGLAYARKRAFDRAEIAFRRAIDLKPDYAEAYNRLATVYNAQRRFDEAQTATQEAARLSGGAAIAASDADPSDALFTEAIVLWNTGRIAEARSGFERVLELDPERAEAHYWLGMAHLNQGSLPAALQALERYLALAPDGPYAAQARQAIDQVRK